MYISISLSEWIILIFNVFSIVLIVLIHFKRRKMSTVLLKLKTKKIFLNIVLGTALLGSISDLVYYLLLQNKNLSMVIDKSQSIFFCMLMLYCLLNANRITEKGIALSDTLFEWQNIESWSWADNSSQVLMIDVLEERKRKKIKKKSKKQWRVHPAQKESVDRILNLYMPEKNRNK
jgi:uncharacterized membrane protein